MKALLIDSANKKVKTVTITDDEFILEQWCELLNVSELEIGVTLPNNDDILVDEDALFKHYQHGFSYEGNYFLGNGLVVGTDFIAEGPADCKTSLKLFNKTIKFHDRKDLGEVYETSKPMSF